MANVKNIMKVINTTRGKINPRYDITVEGISEIRNGGKDIVMSILDAFNFGYAQGAKATKAEMKKGGAV
jgi:hypothetical protein